MVLPPPGDIRDNEFENDFSGNQGKYYPVIFKME